MTGIFKERNTFQVPILIVVAILVKMAYILHPPVIEYKPDQGLLTDAMNNWYQGKGSNTWSAILAFIMLFGSGIYFNALLMGQRMFSRANMLVALSMVMMSSLVPEANVLSAPIILLPLLIWTYQTLISFYHSRRPRSSIFNSGLAIGAGAIAYHPFILLFPVALYALATMRPFHLKEWVILLLGILTPYYFLFAWLFLSDAWQPLHYIPKLQFGYGQFNKDAYSLLADGMIFIWVVIGFFYWQANLRRMLIQARKNWNILLLATFICTIILLIRSGSQADAFVLTLMPLTSFAACAFAYPRRNFFPTLLFWVIAFIVLLTCLKHYDGKI